MDPQIVTTGQKLARYLPYNVSSPPEELWSKLLSIASDTECRSRQLESTNQKTLEFEFVPDEVKKEVSNGR